MAQRSNLRRPLPPVVVVLVLLAFVLVGLAAGAGARSFINGLALTTSLTPATHTPGTAHPTATNTVPSATATSTALPTISAPSGFQLILVVAPPGTVTPGQQFTVIVSVVAADGHTPLPGVLCTMSASQDGGVPLFQQWPAPQVSDNLGKARWNLQAPQLSPGNYTLQVSAHGAGGWIYHIDHTVVISSS